MMKEDDRERRRKGGYGKERDTGETGTEEQRRQRRNPDRGGHGRARREMEQGKKREAVRDKEKDREDDGDTQNYKVIDSFLHPFTHSVADGQMAATKQLLDPDSPTCCSSGLG